MPRILGGIIVRAKNSAVYGQGFAPPGRRLFSVSKSRELGLALVKLLPQNQ